MQSFLQHPSHSPSVQGAMFLGCHLSIRLPSIYTVAIYLYGIPYTFSQISSRPPEHLPKQIPPKLSPPDSSSRHLSDHQECAPAERCPTTSWKAHYPRTGAPWWRPAYCELPPRAQMATKLYINITCRLPASCHLQIACQLPPADCLLIPQSWHSCRLTWLYMHCRINYLPQTPVFPAATTAAPSATTLSARACRSSGRT
jgi:hypothetical protein